MDNGVRELIIRRRRQLAVHSFIYYQLNDSLVSDQQWQTWADELVELQAYFGTDAGFYDTVFKDWDASTGYHLPTTSDIERVARRLLNYETTEGIAMANEINIRDIQTALGLKITADFILNELFVKPCRTDKKAVFWDVADGPKIKALLVEHINDSKPITPGMGGDAPKPASKVVAPKVVANSIDDEL
jgi:hypothetical protein